MDKTIEDQLEELNQVSIDPQRNELNFAVNYGDLSRIQSSAKSDKFAGLDPKKASELYTKELKRVAENCPAFAPHDACLMTASMPEYANKTCVLCKNFNLGSCHIYQREKDKNDI